PATAVSTAPAAAVASSTPTAEGAEAPTPPRPWVIAEIAVSGNRNASANSVRSEIKARKGDLYDRPDLDRDVQAILGLGQFERVSADVSATDKPVPSNLAKVAGSPFM